MSEIDQEKQEVEKNATIELSEIEEAATAQGWNPEKGELSALEFLKNGRVFRDRMFNEIKDLKEDNAKAYNIVAQHITQQQQKEHAAEQKSIEDQILEAAEAGETEKVRELTQQIKQPPQPVQPADPHAAYVDDWRGKNAWYDSNNDMHSYARGEGQRLANELKTSDPAIILPKVEEAVKRIFPDYFKPQNPNRDRGAGAEKQGGKPSTKASMNDLTEAEKLLIPQFVKMGMKEDTLIQSVLDNRHE